MNIFKRIFRLGSSVDLKQLVRDGAQIVDVRTKAEYKTGHVKGSVNIPLQALTASLSLIKKDKPVITCCASGMRSGSAKKILNANGFENVINAGGWRSLEEKIR